MSVEIKKTFANGLAIAGLSVIVLTGVVAAFFSFQ